MKYTLVFSYSICFVIVSFMDKTLTLPTKTDHYRKEQRDSTTEGKLTELDLLDISCYDQDGQPYTHLLPHPYNCSQFLLCRYFGGDIYLAHQQDCQRGTHGLLTYDFMTGRCEDPVQFPEVECYDINNEAHVANRFKCAVLEPSDSPDLPCSG